MYRFISCCVSAFAILLAFQNTLVADLITYEFAGVASGNLDGVDFTNKAFSFTLTGDTTSVDDSTPDLFVNPIRISVP